MMFDPVCNCPNMHMRFYTPYKKPLVEIPVVIETSKRQIFVTDNFGSISWHETDFVEDGRVLIEFADGGRHLAWNAKLPTEPGSYELFLNTWTNDADGSE